MTTVKVKALAGVFAEDKDVAARVREVSLRPAVTSGKQVTISFAGCDGATQSFIHAMISDLIRRHGEDVLDLLIFKDCNETIKSVIQIVTEYSQLDVEECRVDDAKE